MKGSSAAPSHLCEVGIDVLSSVEVTFGIEKTLERRTQEKHGVKSLSDFPTFIGVPPRFTVHRSRHRSPFIELATVHRSSEPPSFSIHRSTFRRYSAILKELKPPKRLSFHRCALRFATPFPLFVTNCSFEESRTNAWCETKAIVQINTILREIDQTLDVEHEIVFPRIINWSLLKLRSKKIEELFPKKDEDHGNPMIRATLNLDEAAIPQHGADEIGKNF
ncbi:hypothetical protein LR48_Vigan11g117300 [Vigna angularis]|uniref:Uncharacterized protein n=1 Tax=Phaseolus angularis TaxID=3914 RepID=A0A0L9VTP5_PHAAN|nr:hypothetical protein LR48_Vigan11g117300 [Vigna angularis]